MPKPFRSGYLEYISDERIVELWRARRAGREPAGSSDRAMVALRLELSRRGLSDIIYEERSERPCERCAETELGERHQAKMRD